jgi:hypothetical protein
MRFIAVLVALVLSGCGPDCAPGPNIQVTVLAGPSVDATRVATLRIVLSVDGMAPKTLDVPITHPLTMMPKTLLLQPDPPPADKYNIALSVQALDSTGSIFALGTAASDVTSNGCNRLEASLFPLGSSGGDGGGVDGFIPPDLMSTDMSNCTVVSASIPDEDGDNRADSCDLCPDDYDPTPVDSDLDGLPDACDPDPARPSNTLLYFDPFNANSGNWSGNFVLKAFPAGYWQIDTGPNNGTNSGNSLVSLPVNVRVQAHTLSPGIYPTGQQSADSDVGLFLGNSSNPFLSGTNGVLCVQNPVTINGMDNDQLVIYTVQGGNTINPQSIPIPGGWHTGTMYRLRLTQRSNVYTCELESDSLAPVTVSKTLTAAPTGPLFMSLVVQNMEAHFHAVVVESVLP